MERTLELWHQASARIESAIDRATTDDARNAARVNHQYVVERIAVLEPYRDDPPPECATASPPPSGSSNDRGEEGSRNEESEEDEQNEPSATQAEEPPASEDEAGGGVQAPPMSESEREQIRQLLTFLREHKRAEGKFYRGSRSEQRPRESWRNPDKVIKQ